jgi:peptidoglycan hydrolase-like protein with peptidoglycan-binding domain
MRPFARPFRPYWDSRGFPDRDRILWAQSCLARTLGSWVLQDGVLGPNTETAIRRFQEQQLLPVTGLLDNATMNTLHTVCAN